MGDEDGVTADISREPAAVVRAIDLNAGGAASVHDDKIGDEVAVPPHRYHHRLRDDCKPTEELPLMRLKQFVAPLDRCPLS